MSNNHATRVLGAALLFAAHVVYADGLGAQPEAAGREARKPSETAQRSLEPLAALKAFLAEPRDQRPPISEQAFAQVGLTKEQAAKAREMLWDDHVAWIRASRAGEMESRVLEIGEHTMPFEYQVFGKKPKGGRSLYISMHGGGGAPKQVNDQQWRNQQRLYQPPEGVYVAPRAPTDQWNLWHLDHIDRFFDRLIENLVAIEGVDANRVYLMGYSAGGDGVYQLAPRMADRWAAAAMMAGHPNDASPLGLRNLGFAIYVGGRDAAYQRNQIAAEWKTKLAELKAGDPEGYRHLVTIYPDKGHWMDRWDVSSIDWMHAQTRNPLPKKIVWKQDDVTHTRSYWLATAQPRSGALVVATLDAQRVAIEASDVASLTVRLSDAMLDLDKAVQITSGDRTLHEQVVPRTIHNLALTLAERGDRELMFAGEVTVKP